MDKAGLATQLTATPVGVEPAMTAKSERIEMRVDPERHQIIQAAAAAVHEGTSDFVRRAAMERAERILARTERTLMPAEQFDALLFSLDTADEAPTLARAFTRPRRFKRG
jgi:uncharacterized protein (DUF1778 family)